MPSYTISQAAAHSGLSSKQIRDYELKGLLPAPSRNSSGYRVYTEHDVHLLFFIAQARSLGFSLAQIKALLVLWQDKNRSSAQVKQLAQQHIDALESQAQQLHQIADILRQFVQQCRGDERPDCPILKGLELPL